MSGFLPVPHEALDACVDQREIAAVVDLYRRAHRLRWKQFRVTERALCTSWEIGNRKLWALLDQLAALDLIALEKGTKRTPTLITVACPTREMVQQCAQRSDQQNDTGSTPETEDGAAEDAAEDAALLNETRDRDLSIRDVFDVWQTWHPLAKKPSKVFGRHVGGRLAEGYTVEQLQAVARWAHTSGDSHALFLRQGGHLGPETLYKPTKMLDRVEAAMKSPQGSSVVDVIWEAFGQGGQRGVKKLAEQRGDVAALVRQIGGLGRFYGIDRFQEREVRKDLEQAGGAA